MPEVLSDYRWEASQMLRELAEPSKRGDSTKRALERAAKAAGLHYWRAYDIWYRKARRIEAGEHQKIKAALRSKNERAARIELRQLRQRLAFLESRLRSGDEDFNGPTIDLVREQLRGGG